MPKRRASGPSAAPRDHADRPPDRGEVERAIASVLDRLAPKARTGPDGEAASRPGGTARKPHPDRDR